MEGGGFTMSEAATPRRGRHLRGVTVRHQEPTPSNVTALQVLTREELERILGPGWRPGPRGRGGRSAETMAFIAFVEEMPGVAGAIVPITSPGEGAWRVRRRLASYRWNRQRQDARYGGVSVVV